MIENTCPESDVEDALQVIRLLKNYSSDDVVWEQVEEVLLFRSGAKDAGAADELPSGDATRAEKQGSCCCVRTTDLGGDSLVRYDDDRLQKALLFIHQHLDESFGVQDIARDICVSRRWLEYAFRAAFGITPFQYLRCVRLELARMRLISEPQSKVHQIALNSGFTSARQFTMTFRQYFGYSPSVCRNQGDGDCLAGIGPLAEAC